MGRHTRASSLARVSDADCARDGYPDRSHSAWLRLSRPGRLRVSLLDLPSGGSCRLGHPGHTPSNSSTECQAFLGQ